MAVAQAHRTSHVEQHEIELAGLSLGTIERCYGLLRTTERVLVTEVFSRSGDLAVADRVAYLYAGRQHTQVVVFELDGWYYVGTIDRHLSLEQAAGVQPVGDSPRLLSLVSTRGIAPVVSPLA